MPIDPRIALGVQPMQLESPVNQMAKVYALQNAAQENQLGQAKLAEYQRQIEDRNALRSTLAGFTPGMSTEAQVSALQRGGHLPEARSLAESAAKVAADKRAEEKSALDAEAKRLEIRGQAYGSVAANPTVENARGVLQYLLTNRLVDENGAAQAWQQIQANPTPDNIRGMAQQFQMMSVNAKDQLAARHNELTAQETRRHNITTEGTAARQADIAAGRLELEKTKLGTGEEINPKERQKREAAYPKVSGAYRAATHEIDSLADDIARLKDHPGLSGITGLIAGRTPNLTGPAREAQALLDRIVAKGQFRGLQAMREASPTGGALGNVSDKEGAALRSAFGALNQTQNTADFRNALNNVLSDLNFSKGNIQQTFEDTYAYRPSTRGKAGEEAPAAKPGAKKTASGVSYTVED